MTVRAHVARAHAARAAPRTVRVRTEVAAVTKEFDYVVPPTWDHDVRVGTRVRAPLHGRSVRGWVVEVDTAVPTGVDVLPLKSWLGWGPPAGVVALARWAAWRWAGPPSFFLHAASPATIVRALPSTPEPSTPTASGEDVPAGRPAPQRELAAATALLDLSEAGVDVGPETASVSGAGATMVRWPPTADPLGLVLAVLEDVVARARVGSTVVLVPSSGWAERLARRLARRGWPVATSWDEARAGWPVVVGTRTGAWAPVPHLAAAVVLDAHDAAYREESAPTYSAVDVLLERARRDGAPCVLVSPVPPVALGAVGGLRTRALPSHDERAGWPTLERVDRRGADPRTGLFSEEFVRLARAVLSDAEATGRGPLVCVYNRTGGARLLACAHCGELARCARCGAAATRPRQAEVLRCPRCGETRPVVCAACGRLRLKTLRAGVSRLREELVALLGVEVGEVAGPHPHESEPWRADAPVLVGTEAVLHRLRRAAAVAFLDVDLHLLAPRLSAVEETLALLVRAGRLVGARGGARWARLQLQSRVPEHPVLQAAARGEPEPVLQAEVALRRDSALPPFSALALVSGALAPAYADALTAAASALPSPDRAATRGGTVGSDAGPAVTVASLGGDRFLVQAAGHRALCDLLAGTPRPPGRGLRVEVDPAAL